MEKKDGRGKDQRKGREDERENLLADYEWKIKWFLKKGWKSEGK